MAVTKKVTTYEKCIADFPDEALSCDSSRGFDLTSVKAQYVKERLNQVFGVTGWAMTGTYEQVGNGSGVIYYGKLSVIDPDTSVSHTHESVGFAQIKRNIGDAFKGAQTDALSKCSSNLGIANEIFKGNVAPPKKGSKAAPKAAAKGKGKAAFKKSTSPQPQPMQQNNGSVNPFAAQTSSNL